MKYLKDAPIAKSVMNIQPPCVMFRVVMLAALACPTTTMVASTYYVDYSSGSDTNDGMSVATPWQHVNGDSGAVGVAASTTLRSGDTVNFKGGIIYYATNVNYYCGLYLTSSGSAKLPITLRSDSGWGTGPAVIDGTGAPSNVSAVGMFGKWTTFSGFKVQNFNGAAVAVSADYCTVSNCKIQNIGIFPYTNGLTGYGNGIAIVQNSGSVLVSNVIANVTAHGISTSSATNFVVYGNEIYNAQSHGIIASSVGYGLLAYNYIHDETNVYNHSDAIQVIGNTLGSSMIVCDNTISNCVDAMNFQPRDASGAGGKFYCFNNVTCNTIPGATGLGGWSNGSEFDISENIDSLYVWNNTFVDENAGWGGFRGLTSHNAPPNYAVTNVAFFNNLYFDSIGGQNPTNTNSTGAAILNLFTGYDCFANVWRIGNTVSGDPMAGNNLVSLARYQADVPGQEINSISGLIMFAKYVNVNGIIIGDYHLASGSAAIGSGTNLSVLLPSTLFAALPAGYQVDPTKDIIGNQRPSTTAWDVGAFQYKANAGILPHPPGTVFVAPQ